MVSPEHKDSLALRLGNILLGGRTNLGLTQESVRDAAGLTHASQPTVSKWERADQIEPLEYAVRLARAERATREALADIIGASAKSILEPPDAEVSEMTYRVAIARHRADWTTVRSALDAILPKLRQNDRTIARADLARVLAGVVGVDSG
jgi:transcriptional regulator with XRE-family HTH domain